MVQLLLSASIVMESGYNYQYLYDLLKGKGYNVKVADPLMVKAIAYAKVNTDKVDEAGALFMSPFLY